MLVSLMPRNFPRDLIKQNLNVKPIPVPARSKVWVYGRWLVGVAGSNPAGDMEFRLLQMVYFVS
jgi:hypothetical protein